MSTEYLDFIDEDDEQVYAYCHDCGVVCKCEIEDETILLLMTGG